MKENQILYKVTVSEHGVVYYVVASNIQDAENKTIKRYLKYLKANRAPASTDNLDQIEIYQITILGKEDNTLILD